MEVLLLALAVRVVGMTAMQFGRGEDAWRHDSGSRSWSIEHSSWFIGLDLWLNMNDSRCMFHGSRHMALMAMAHGLGLVAHGS